MPMQRSLYPADWRAVSLRIRQREGYRCKWCGAAHDTWAVGVRGTPYRIVLTVAHLNHDPADCRDENLVALCQPCHLRYDVTHHKRNAARTRRQRQIDHGQGVLFAEGEVMA